MKDDRLRVPIDDAYVQALGRMTYVFATLEWNAVWCCERMQTNYINRLGRKTAGIIADDLVHLAGKRPDPQLRTDCLGPSKEFKRLVKLRNGILHGKPGTAPTLTKEQRLFQDGQPWTPAMIDDAADEFAACSILLNALLYNQLK
jgi:hypothetical protein